jgi:hypothetical protein
VVYHIPTSKVDFAADIIVRRGTIVPGKTLRRDASGSKCFGTPGVSNSSQTTNGAPCRGGAWPAARVFDAQKKWPRGSRPSLELSEAAQSIQAASNVAAGNVAVADRHLGVDQQQAIDRGKQAGEGRAGGRECDGGRLGHWVPFLNGSEPPPRDPRTIYVYQIPQTTDLFAWQHFEYCNAARWPWKRAGGTKRPPQSAASGFRHGWNGGYSAACLRGGSSAPESWISAT